MKITSENIQVKIEGKSIVHNISIDVDRGKFVGIIGPNGSGKSTFLKSLYRVLSPSAGTFYVDHKCLQNMTFKESAQKMAVVTQHNHFNFEFSVWEMVMMGRTPHKKKFERDTLLDCEIVEEALKRVEMLSFKDRSFSTLSGGEQQRIMLARALAQRSKCLILDEPTNHLDIKHQLKIMDLAKSLGVTVVAALHDLNVAASYCDYLYVLKDGDIFAEGIPKEILTEENIYQVYEVAAKVFKDSEEDRIHIAYRSGGGASGA